MTKEAGKPPIVEKKKTNEDSSKRKKFFLKALVIFVLVLLTLVSPGGWALAYKGKIYPNVKVAGISVGGMNKEEASKVLEPKIAELKQLGPTLVFNDEKLNPSLEELGVSFNTESAINSAYDYGRNETFRQKLGSYFNIVKGKAELDLPLDVNQEKLATYVGGLTTKYSKEAQNASADVVNGQVVVRAAVDGIGISSEQILEKLNAFINGNPTSANNNEINLELTSLKADIQAADTQTAVSQAEHYLASSPITVNYAEKQWVADKNEIGEWLIFTPNNSSLTVSVDSSGFTKAISSQVSISAKARQVEDGTGTVIDEGQDGLGVDERVLGAQIKTALETGQNKELSLPVFDIPREQKIVYPHAQPGRFDGHYIDINLSEQTLYAFDGATQVNSFLVSTGKRGYATPTGEFHVYGKNRVTTMDGADYYLPGVQWVSWFLGDYSIHGTYWHNNFGTPMSHGCVNASNANAEWVYNFVEVGTPVYVHY